MRAALFLAGAGALALTAGALALTAVGMPTCAPAATRAADVGSFVQVTTCKPFFRSKASYLPATFAVQSGKLPPGLSVIRQF